MITKVLRSPNLIKCDDVIKTDVHLSYQSIAWFRCYVFSVFLISEFISWLQNNEVSTRSGIFYFQSKRDHFLLRFQEVWSSFPWALLFIDRFVCKRWCRFCAQRRFALWTVAGYQRACQGLGKHCQKLGKRASGAIVFLDLLTSYDWNMDSLSAIFKVGKYLSLVDGKILCECWRISLFRNLLLQNLQLKNRLFF